ncbi:thioesterase family protein [Aquisalimonas sp.]|uniref:thioesterase family protein n=1 Tax=Aquisalimonas sp. TaxID=1872621 RepID=UPI0025C68784|nr:thioesterase family protein [Aquisalimonas sp.]
MTTPLTLVDAIVPPEWVDYNGHMNDATYAVAFSRAVDLFIEHLGMDAAFRSREQLSVYTLETHTRFLRESFERERLLVDLQLLDRDAKRAHVFLRLLDEHSSVRATSEQMLMAMDMHAGRPTAFRGEPAQRLDALAQEHRELAPPDGAGRRIGLAKR